MDALSLALMMFGIAIVIIVGNFYHFKHESVKCKKLSMYESLKFFPPLDSPEFFLTL